MYNMNFKIKAFDAVPTRLVLAAAILVNCIVNYIYRVNISLNIIAMVKEANTTTVKSECAALIANQSSVSDGYESLMIRRTPEDSMKFDWTTQQQAYILSGYFWGYLITSLIGGPLAELCGPRKLIFTTTVLSAVLTIFSPQIAKIHYLAMVANRILIGFLAGAHFPATHTLTAAWAPPDEKGVFVSLIGGTAIGTVLTWSLTGPLIENYGWEYAFYATGFIVLAWAFLWLYLVYDTPELHPRVTDKEKKFILNAIGDKVQHDSKKVIPPMKSIMTSIPCIAMIVLQFGNAWGLYFTMTAAPTYISTALGFNLTSTGSLSSLPYLARAISLPVFGAIGDAIVRRKIISTTVLRKSFCIVSHIIPGILLASLGYAGCSPYLSVAIITLVFALNGSVSINSLVNNHDLAPNYAGTLFGIANGFASVSGFITPLVTAHFTKNGNGFSEWRPVFLVGASMYIITAVFFILFGSTQVQPWNEIIESDKKKNDKRDKLADILE